MALEGDKIVAKPRSFKDILLKTSRLEGKENVPDREKAEVLMGIATQIARDLVDNIWQDNRNTYVNADQGLPLKDGTRIPGISDEASMRVAMADIQKIASKHGELNEAFYDEAAQVVMRRLPNLVAKARMKAMMLPEGVDPLLPENNDKGLTMNGMRLAYAEGEQLTSGSLHVIGSQDHATCTFENGFPQSLFTADCPVNVPVSLSVQGGKYRFVCNVSTSTRRTGALLEIYTQDDKKVILEEDGVTITNIEKNGSGLATALGHLRRRLNLQSAEKKEQYGDVIVELDRLTDLLSSGREAFFAFNAKHILSSWAPSLKKNLLRGGEK